MSNSHLAMDPAADRPSTHDPLLAGLNPEQAQAVSHGEGPLLILAGAGSGKTRVITRRMAWLVERMDVPAHRILAVTFSNKAAGEMRSRIESLLGPRGEDIWLGTFHSIGVRILRQIGHHVGIDRSFTIYDRDDQLKMIKRAMRALNISDKVVRPRSVASYIDRAKNRCLLPGDPALERRDVFERKAFEIYARYDADLHLANGLDFGDLLMRPVQILTEQPVLRDQYARRFAHVLVDEFQDTNTAQYNLLTLLVSDHHNLCVVGDDDQSIYSWRGAEIGNILRFADRFAATKTIKLERNYRSTKVILAASSAVVSHNQSRHPKKLWTDVETPEPVHMFEAETDRDEADWVGRRIETLRRNHPLSEFAVFYRTNAQSRVLEESMNRFRLPYMLIGGLRFYERAEVKDLLAYCRLVVNTTDSASWLRAVNTPRRGIGRTSVELVETRARQLGLSMPMASRSLVADDTPMRSRGKLAVFEELLDTMRIQTESLSAGLAGIAILKMSGLRKALKSEESLQAESRLENLGELLSAMQDHADTADDPSLAGFLEQVALVSDIDSLDDRKQAVSLMTMHAAKGLEYDVTFIVGLEEGLVPHSNAIAEHNVDEERRLLYVAMTRARKLMHLCHARLRRRFGSEEPCLPSPFIRHIPRELIKSEVQARSRGFGWQRPATSSAYGRPHTPRTAIASTAAWRKQGRAGSTSDRFGKRPATETPRLLGDEPSNPQETVIEREPGEPLQAGSVVGHVRFGRGEVIDVAGYGEMARVTVHFPRVGMKKVVARFLKPA